MFGRFLEEVVSGFLDQSLESLSGLTTTAVLRGDLGVDVLLDVETFPRCETEQRLRAVDDEQTVGVPVDEHLLELRDLERGVTSVSE